MMYVIVRLVLNITTLLLLVNVLHQNNVNNYICIICIMSIHLVRFPLLLACCLINVDKFCII